MITLEDLILAGRKAKVDRYCSTNPPLFDMADYEDNLPDHTGYLILPELAMPTRSVYAHCRQTQRATHLDLRKFQSSYRSPSKSFKPVPDGFHDAMDCNRRVLPEGESA